MKITHVIGIFSPEHGGPVVSLTNYVAGQVAAGLTVRVRTIEGYPDVSPAIRLPAPVDQRVFPVGWPAKMGRSAALSQQMAREDSPDIYHLHGAWLRVMYYGYREANRRKKPYLVQVNGSYQPYDLRRKPWRKRLFRLWFQDRIFHEATCLHVNSLKEALELKQMGFKRPMVVIPAGFHVAEAKKNLALLPAAGVWPELEDRPFFLYLARVHPNKGIGLLLEAWAQLAKEFPEHKLVIVGTGEPDYVAQYRLQAKRSGIGDRCLWKGYVSDLEKTWAYAHASFYCLPSFTENFGNTVQEALGFGTPVLTTTETPWTELERLGCGWIAEPTTASLGTKLAAALRTTEKERRTMGELGRLYIEQEFSLDSVIAKQVATYQWLLGGPAPSIVV